MLIAGKNGAIEYADPAARRWIKEFFSRPARRGILPRQINQWIATRDGGSQNRSLVAKRAAVQLHIKRELSYIDNGLVLVLERTKVKEGQRCRWHLNLTAREREVLFWVAYGKSNPDIGVILGIATSTVGKHVERIYAKLGFENRVAASRFCFDELRNV